MNLNDEWYMKRAIELAERGEGRVHPNPLVGAVLVKDGRIIGEDWHQEYGGLHAERNAFLHCSEDAQGATLYVTLEPCCHYGKTPPCTQAIIEHKVSRVVVGVCDPNPLVSGKGFRQLREHGIKVQTGVLEAECRRQNRVFFHYITTKTPYVILKYAMTLDGKIATVTGESMYITGEEARRHVHQTRGACMGIMAGIGTVLADDPMLNCRLPDSKDPMRIICDDMLRIPLESRILKTAGEIPTVIATLGGDRTKREQCERLGAKLLTLPAKDGRLDLKELMRRLGEMGIDSILLEGGGTLNEAALKAGIVQRIQAYIAPKLLGGADAKTPVEGEGIRSLQAAYRLKTPEISRLGEDILLESEVEPCLPEL